MRMDVMEDVGIATRAEVEMPSFVIDIWDVPMPSVRMRGVNDASASIA